MQIFAALIAGLFLFVGVRFMFGTIITGTSAGEAIVVNVVPILIGAATVAVVIRVFRH